MTTPTLPRGADGRSVEDRINQIIQGKINATKSVTLTANDTTTTITDPRISAASYIGLMPTTATASAAMDAVYVSARTSGSATLTHDNTADVDRTYVALIIG